MQTELAVIASPHQAASLLDPVRARLLDHLREPDSAAGAARTFRLPRQRVGYHVRELERAGLLETVGERKQGNCVERLLQATARRYVISPDVLKGTGLSPEKFRDRFSSEYLIATAARVIQEVGTLRQRAAEAEKILPTLTIETEVRFASLESQNAFATELAACIARLVSEHHDERAPKGRSFRVIAAAHPSLPRDAATAEV